MRAAIWKKLLLEKGCLEGDHLDGDHIIAPPGKALRLQFNGNFAYLISEIPSERTTTVPYARYNDDFIIISFTYSDFDLSGSTGGDGSSEFYCLWEDLTLVSILTNFIESQ